MKIVCPKCDLKGEVDVASASAKTRIACVRCATTFDAIFTDGQIQALTQQAAPVEMALERSDDNDASTTAIELASPVEPQQELQLNYASQPADAPAPADDFSASSTDDLALELEEEMLETSWSMSPQEVATEFAWQDAGAQSVEAPFDSQAAVVPETPFKAVDVSRVGQPADAYGIGVRLMRVSPMWLLLAGLSFISFIVLCNWLIKPDEKNGDAARMLLADNHATNQSSKRIVAPDSTAQSPVNNQAAQSAANSGVSFIPAEATQAAPSIAPTPGAETIEKPAVEEQAAAPAASSHQPAEAKAGSEARAGGEAKAGKVTIQIGSYNEAAQAEERVANLKSAGYEAQSIAVEIPKRGTWYRVQSGRFVNRNEAERYGKQLRDKGVVSSFITTDVQE